MNWTYKEFRKYITVTAIEGVQVTIVVDKIACYYEDLENKNECEIVLTTGKALFVKHKKKEIDEMLFGRSES